MVSLRLCLIIALTALPLGESKQFLQHIADTAAGDMPAETLANVADEGSAAADSTGESDESDDSVTTGVPIDEEMNARVEAVDVDDTDDSADSSAATAADSEDNAADTVDDKPMEASSLLQTDDSEDNDDDEADDSETEDEDEMADEEEVDKETAEEGDMNEEEQAEIEESEMEEDEANN